MRKWLGLLLILAGFVLVVTVLYKNSKYGQATIPFSSHSLIESSWVKYKQKFINKDGRVIDYNPQVALDSANTDQDITTSEGQSYALLRAVWVDDKSTFDQVWKWTRETLKRPKDELFGWRWGSVGDGHYDFLKDGGVNSAAD